jgi:hypothetical protein
MMDSSQPEKTVTTSQILLSGGMCYLNRAVLLGEEPVGVKLILASILIRDSILLE